MEKKSPWRLRKRSQKNRRRTRRRWSFGVQMKRSEEEEVVNSVK